MTKDDENAPDHRFDQGYWDAHWRQAHDRAGADPVAANPYLARETAGLPPGTALEAGCGEGAEALWLASQGWLVTAADISSEALDRARDRAAGVGAAERIEWVEADLSTWEPARRFDLVTTHYAHPAMPQLAFYRRLSQWVAPGGSLLIVGHLHTGEPDQEHTHGHGHAPEEATVTATSVTAALDPSEWAIVTAEESVRALGDRAGQEVTLHDVVVRAVRHD